MIAFHTLCAHTQGQILPEDKRSHAKTYPTAMISATNTTIDKMEFGADVYTPLSMRGVCQIAQMKPLMKIGAGKPESINRVSM